ncbi:hypothetical protein FCE95_15350 [Luteimonas gilva]|uniref:Asparagine synthetase domain-containing protein n=1 Tax=Luteimonas gilva TaxID=2572684 RepID=A0A4U5JT30_9GAMM|nr:asparagine synthase-related protein [Luteimonas gilva]TKR29509.1 hypothetical protein FCE95_15350 [Luteimonas gilva]
MLKADIVLSDLAHSVEWRDGAIFFGGSHIRPYPHPALETLLVRTRGQWFAIVRERSAAIVPIGAESRDVDAEEFGRLYRECMLWPLDYAMVEAAQAGHRLKLRAGALGAAPVYCRAGEDRVVVSWDIADFAGEPSAIDMEIASRRLALRSAYSARQLCVGTMQLTERASLYVEPGKASYRYPSPSEAPEAAPLPADRDALAEFERRLHRVASARPFASARISAELSGGMDSATVAAALAALHGRIASVGILLDGDTRDAQIARRKSIVGRLGLDDATVEIAEYPPSLDLRPQPGQIAGFYWEYYLEACAASWISARSRGGDALFTGIGGDELFPAYADEITQTTPERGDGAEAYAERLLTPRASSAARGLSGFDAPASPVPATSLLAQACRAPYALRHGLWPVNPLADPGLVAFCHRLPREHRQERELMRRYLHAHLGEGVFPRGYVKETFAHVLPALIARHAGAIAAQLRDCALADLGIVDRKAVLALLDSVAATPTPGSVAALAMFLWMERFARQLS